MKSYSINSFMDFDKKRKISIQIPRKYGIIL